MGSKTSKPGWLRRRGTLAAIIIVAIIVASSVGAYVLVNDSKTVKAGDLVRVNYIGKLPNGQVFDTSLYSVATDNVTYPKSLFFSFRGNATTYNTLNFTVGQGQMIKGFDNGMLGMKVGETRTLVIPPEQAYGNANESKISTLNLTETVPVQKSMSVEAFVDYFGSVPLRGYPYTDPNYGWEVNVLSSDSSNVIIQNKIPAGGATYRAFDSPSDSNYGWNITVEYDESFENIIIHHQLNASSAMSVKGIDETSTRFYVKSVDEAAGTAVIDRNNQIIGQDLTFIVTLVSIG